MFAPDPEQRYTMIDLGGPPQPPAGRGAAPSLQPLEHGGMIARRAARAEQPPRRTDTLMRGSNNGAFEVFAVTHPRWEPYAGKAARTVLGGGRELNSRPYHVPQSQRKVVELKPCNLLFGLTSGFPQMAGGAAWGKIDSNIRATNLIGDVITKMKRNHATRPI